MTNSSARTTLGLSALFLGGVVGGLSGSWMFASSAPARSTTAAAPSSSGDEGLNAELLRELIRAVEQLALVTPDSSGDARVPADGPAADSPTDTAEIVEALDRLTRALSSAQGRITPGGIGISQLIVPPPGSRIDALNQLVGRDWKALSREHRFLTYQQVLNRFGQPDELSENNWLYHLPSADGLQTFTFKFVDGYLTNIYP